MPARLHAGRGGTLPGSAAVGSAGTRRGGARGTGRLILFNKPYGVVCQFSPHPVRPTLAGFIHVQQVYPAGRLDWDSEGLLVLTGEGGLQHRISHPAAKLAKVYYAQVEGVPDEAALGRLRTGVMLDGRVTRPAGARLTQAPTWLWPRQPPIRSRVHIPTSWVRLELVEGRNRQVRRMTAAVGHPTLRLVRWSIGAWTLDGLLPGQSREASLA